MAKVLVTGANGFIGKRLVFALLEQGHEIYAMIRMKGTEFKIPTGATIHFIYGDLRDPPVIFPLFPRDLDAAYYLVHSMGGVINNLQEDEVTIASHFIKEIEKTYCQQIVFLSGIIEDRHHLSPHLCSRLLVEEELKKSRIPVTIMRASIIIGSGSASFEIIRDLVEKLPIMVAPKWIHNYCQPIAIKDVLYYLCQTLLNNATYDKTFDIGGPKAFTFKDILLSYADFRKLKRIIINVPVLTPKLSSYWLVLITSVRFSICRYLVESMKHSTRKLNHTIDDLIPHSCLSYQEALQLAFQKIAQNEVVSTWMDAWEIPLNNHKSIEDYIEVPSEGCFKDIQQISFPIDKKSTIIKRIWKLGGKQGWYSMDWAWSLRGILDQLLGGTGMNRGRRHPEEISPGDSIDFWRVLIANKEKGHLILYAEMKLPGEAWLEFKIDPSGSKMIQTATFRPKGFLGVLYWKILVPFHWIIFKEMARSLTK